MLLDKMGVAIACVTPTFLDADAARTCDLKCNAAADCPIINTFRTSDRGAVSWLRATRGSNLTFSASPSTCAADAKSLEEALSWPTEHCGGSKRDALRKLRDAIAPQHRVAWRWGFKNPHSVYYVNALRALFPCMSYVNTLMDLDMMVRRRKHFASRVAEARRYGIVNEVNLRHVSATLTNSQRFYGAYVRQVNLRLHGWLWRCLPGRFAHVSIQRIVIQGAGADSDDGGSRHKKCLNAAINPLLRAIAMPRTPSIVNATEHFLLASLPTVRHSLDEAVQLPISPGVDRESLRWPLPLEVQECQGALHAKA